MELRIKVTKGMVIMLVACAVVFGGIFGFKWFVSIQIDKFIDQMQQKTPTITTTKVKQADWAQTIDAVGTVKAVNGIALTTRASGIVDSIHFDSGDTVSKGQLLLTLDNTEDRATLSALQAAAHLAEENFQRYQRLYKKGSISKSQLDQMRSKRNQARAQAKAQKARVGFKRIEAPFGGRLGIRQVDLGQYVAPGTTLVTLQSLSPIYVNFAVPAQKLPILEKGLEVEARIDSQPGEVFVGKINAVEPGVSASTRNVSVQAVFDNKKQQLRPGMFASISIKLPTSKHVMVIPRTAVSFHPYGNEVYVVTKAAETAADESSGEKSTTRYVVHSKFVQLGQARGDVVAVIKGLEPGDEVATSGLLNLRQNMPVKIDNSIQVPAKLHPHPDNS